MKRNACQKCVFAVREDNPHCGLRGFRSDFNVEYCSAENNTVPNGYELQEDGYFSWVDKKKEYPKTYEECCTVLQINTFSQTIVGHKYKLITKFQQLLICRDAYWKIAGEERGLGKPWEPRWNDGHQKKYIIYNDSGDIKKGGWFFTNAILAFPTEEMRDAFYENFKSEIEFCKKLL